MNGRTNSCGEISALGPVVKRIRVLLAGDHKAIQNTVAGMLARDFEVVGAVGDGRSTLTEAVRLQPDVLVMDISMPGMTGIEAVRQLTANEPEIKVVFLTVHENADYLRKARAAGVLGYVIRSRMASDLATAINAANDGESFVSPF